MSDKPCYDGASCANPLCACQCSLDEDSPTPTGTGLGEDDTTTSDEARRILEEGDFCAIVDLLMDKQAAERVSHARPGIAYAPGHEPPRPAIRLARVDAGERTTQTLERRIADFEFACSVVGRDRKTDAMITERRNAVYAHVSAAVQGEREACAKIARDYQMSSGITNDAAGAAAGIAHRIKARSLPHVQETE